MYITKEKIVTLNAIKKFCMQARNILTNLSPNPTQNAARHEKPDPTYNSAWDTRGDEEFSVRGPNFLNYVH